VNRPVSADFAYSGSRVLRGRRLDRAPADEDRERAPPPVLRVADAVALEVPAAQLDRRGDAAVDAFVRLGRNRVLKRVRPPLLRGDRLAVGRRAEEARPADLSQIDVRGVGVDPAERHERPREPELRRRVLLLIGDRGARRLGLACGESLARRVV
jgi:hypothetical protein